MKLYVLVENYGLINQDCYVFTDGDEAERKYKEITGVDYKTAMKFFEAEKEDMGAWEKFPMEVVSALSDKEWEQTKIYEMDFTPKGIRICEYESLICPFCGSSKLQPYNLRKTELNQHQIECLQCKGTFRVPCED